MTHQAAQRRKKRPIRLFRSARPSGIIAAVRIAYVHDQLVPTNDTAVEQLINTIAGLVKGGATGTLFLPRSLRGPRPDATELQRYYDVDELFELRFFRSLYPTHRGPEKAAHALRMALYRGLRSYDVVYTRNIPFFFAGALAGLPMVYETYRPWPTQYPALAPLFRRAMRADSFIGAVFHSHYCRERYLEIGVPAERVRAIYNGYDRRRFEPPRSVAEARQALGLPGDRLAVGYTGRILPEKGMDVVLELARRRPEVLFLLVGADGEDDTIEREACDLDNVHIFGWQSYCELPRFLYASDILLIPPTLVALEKARNTVLPMKLFQYLAAGRPVLAPRAPDTAELLRHGTNAMLVEPDDLDAACAGLDRLRESAELRRRLGDAALTLARDLTWEQRAAKILAFIEARRSGHV